MRREDKGKLEVEGCGAFTRPPLDARGPAMTAPQRFTHHDVEHVIGVGSKTAGGFPPG